MELLPLLGVKETIKISSLSSKFNIEVDYNKHHNTPSSYLERVIFQKPDIIRTFQKKVQTLNEPFCLKHFKHLLFLI